MLLRQFAGRPFKFITGLIPLSRQARVVATILPARFWYCFALFASRVQGKVKGAIGGNGPLTEALMLDNWMRALTFYGPFPIPYVVTDAEVLNRNKGGHGVLYCWTHLPLVEIPLRALLEIGHTVDFIVAHPGKIVDGDEFIVPGLSRRVKTLSVDKRVLAKVRTALEEGRSVACLADTLMFGPLSPLVLRVAGMVNAFVIFQWAERQPDGTLVVTFQPAPYPFCATDEEIEENLEFLRLMNRKVLDELHAEPD